MTILEILETLKWIAPFIGAIIALIRYLVKQESRNKEELEEMKQMLQREREASERLQYCLSKAIEFNAEWRAEDFKKSDKKNGLKSA